MGRRISWRITLGLLVGPAIGGTVGLLGGVLWFGGSTTGMWAALIAGLIFGGLGAFWAGLGALGPPAVDDDPLPREQGRPRRR